MWKRWVPAVVLAIALPACGSEGQDVAEPASAQPSAAVPIALVCSTFYRTSVTVPPSDGPVLTLSPNDDESADFSDLRFHATFSSDQFDGTSFRTEVVTVPEAQLVTATLYQFAADRPPPNLYERTGQGFTGLVYASNPASGSELQFFCATAPGAADPGGGASSTSATSSGPVSPGPPTPLLGGFQTSEDVTAALVASGPLTNEEDPAVVAGTAPNLSICAAIVTSTEPTAGVVVHQAGADYQDDRGVVLVFQRDDASREVRMYSTGAADPATGGYRLLFAAPL